MTGRDNIRKVFNRASSKDIETGMEWYFTAHREIAGLSRKHNIPIPVGCGIVAALSPNQSWSTNLLAAERLLSGNPVIPAFPQNIEKAKKILRLPSTHYEFYLGHAVIRELKGPKITAFYQNLVNPSSSRAVCVDAHAYSIWSGKRYTVKDIPNLTARGRYDMIALDYTEVAKELGLKPWQVQAITWVTWRRENGINR